MPLFHSPQFGRALPNAWVRTPFARAYESGVRVRGADGVRDFANLQVLKAGLNFFGVVLLSQPGGHVFKIPEATALVSGTFRNFRLFALGST